MKRKRLSCSHSNVTHWKANWAECGTLVMFDFIICTVRYIGINSCLITSLEETLWVQHQTYQELSPAVRETVIFNLFFHQFLSLLFFATKCGFLLGACSATIPSSGSATSSTSSFWTVCCSDSLSPLAEQKGHRETGRAVAEWLAC